MMNRYDMWIFVVLGLVMSHDLASSENSVMEAADSTMDTGEPAEKSGSSQAPRMNVQVEDGTGNFVWVENLNIGKAIDFEYTVADGAVTITKLKNKNILGKMVIPHTIDGLPCPSSELEKRKTLLKVRFRIARI